jgi:hypothetical protein
LEQVKSAPEAIKERKGRGGRRPGAGRKPDYLKRLGITPMKAAEILAHHDEPKLWSGLLNSKSEDVRFRTLSYLTDRRDGKPKQQVDVSGGLMHAHTVYRDPRLANLSAEELASLDSLTRKLVTAAEDGPHNQKESKPETEAVETVEVASGPCEAPMETENESRSA